MNNANNRSAATLGVGDTAALYHAGTGTYYKAKVVRAMSQEEILQELYFPDHPPVDVVDRAKAGVLFNQDSTHLVIGCPERRSTEKEEENTQDQGRSAI